MCPKGFLFSALKDNTGESAISTVRKQWKTHLKLEAKSFSPLKTGKIVIDSPVQKGDWNTINPRIQRGVQPPGPLGVAYHFRNLYELTTHL